MADPLDEDADVRSHLAALGPAALADCAPSSRLPIARGSCEPSGASIVTGIATLIAMADTDEVVRLLRAIGDLGV